MRGGEIEIDRPARSETELSAMIDLAGWCQMGGVMMGNDMSLEREHSVCVCVCVHPGSMTTQWFTLSLIEPIHRTSQRGFNTRPHNDLYIQHIHITTICLYLKLSLSFSHSFFWSRLQSHIFFLSLSLDTLSASFTPIMCPFLSLCHHFFISFPPTMNLLESAHLIFKLTRQTCTAAELCNVSIDKTHSMPSHTKHTHRHKHTHTHTHTLTCLSAQPWQAYWLLNSFHSNVKWLKNNVFCYGCEWLALSCCVSTSVLYSMAHTGVSEAHQKWL